MKIHFSDVPPDFVIYMSNFAEERNLKSWFHPPDGLLIMGSGKNAIELICDGNKVNFYYFNKYDRGHCSPEGGQYDIDWCEEFCLTDPESLNNIIAHLDKLCS